MTTFLFWNINRKPLESAIVSLVIEHEVDVLMLAECEIPEGVMLRALNPVGKARFYLTESDCRKIIIYTRFPRESLDSVLEGPRLTIRRLISPAQTEILLAVVHFPSKLYWSEESQFSECLKLAQKIRKAEELVGHGRTVLVGDFNMNPFESGLVTASGLHAAMTREIALRKARTVQNEQYPFFYNPMWGRFGDTTEGPPGTYYYPSSEQKTFFWNMFDQVLLRPDLLPFFCNEDLMILTGHNSESFLSPRGVIKSGTQFSRLS
ncbi:MAG: endonuclease/exonuclease/phosphatase family protein [Blastocatellia bacterium]|nr:endonuclease/exonuclease/phosphatase family protein [Blastocatellia bacterium]